MNAHSLKLTIRHPGGRVEAMVVQATRLLVGSGAHCDVRLEGAEAAHEHLLVDLVGGALVAYARHASPPPMCQGRPLMQAELGKEAEIIVAGTRLHVCVVDATDARKRSRAKKIGTSSILALAVFALPGLVYASLRQPGELPIGPPPNEVTPLFDQAAAVCPVTARDQAAASANALRAVAELQREQHPFAVADGLASVSSFDAAAACFVRAGQPADAAAMTASRDVLKRRIEDDYRVHRVRIEHAIEEGEDKVALRELRVLKRLTAGRRGAYITWLDMVERRLDTQSGNAQVP